MNILLTGGTGFIGQALTKAFTEKQWQVTILSRSAKSSPERYVSYLQWDGKKMPLGMGMYDVVINLAGASIAESAWTSKYKEVLRDSRIHATQACVDYINKSVQKPKLFISASAIGFYGGARDEKTPETATAGDDFLAVLSKEWEDVSQKAKCRIVNPRISVVLGNEGGAFPLMATAYNFFVGGKLGSGKQGFSWIHIDDIVKAFLFFIENEQIEGPVNLAAPELVNQKTFSSALAKTMGRPDVIPAPKFALNMIFGERSILFWGGQWAVPQKLQEVGFTYDFPELMGALEDLV
ncbi:MAG: TIGR01777 family oxidoreductase [Bacteroidota bacterium]